MKGQPGFFDLAERHDKLTQTRDPLVMLKKEVDWEAFRGGLAKMHEKDRKSAAGAKPWDVVCMFKLLILQRIYNLSDGWAKPPLDRRAESLQQKQIKNPRTRRARIRNATCKKQTRRRCN